MISKRFFDWKLSDHHIVILSTQFGGSLMMFAMSSDESDSDFQGFNVADFNRTLSRGFDNDSDINVSSVKTGELSQSSNEKRRVNEPGSGSDNSSEQTWNGDKLAKHRSLCMISKSKYVDTTGR